MKDFIILKDFLISLFTMGALGALAIIVIVFLVTIGWALIGWCIVAVVGLFTTVSVSGYFTYTAIGLVTHLIVGIFK